MDKSIAIGQFWTVGTDATKTCRNHLKIASGEGIGKTKQIEIAVTTDVTAIDKATYQFAALCPNQQLTIGAFGLWHDLADTLIVTWGKSWAVCSRRLDRYQLLDDLFLVGKSEQVGNDVFNLLNRIDGLVPILLGYAGQPCRLEIRGHNCFGIERLRVD